MLLKFPYARLFMYNLLADSNVTGVEAIALCACEFGLLDKNSAQLLQESCQSTSACNCMQTAKQVLVKYFAQKANDTAVDTDIIWSVLQTDVEKYAGDPADHDKETQEDCVHDCAKFAPAVFDLLLQQIRCYS